MKTIKLSFLFIFFALLTCNITWAQKVIHTEAILTFEASPFGDEIGNISGTAVYHFIIKLNKEGYMESIHWRLADCELEDDDGNNVKMFDVGFDSFGGYWDIFNNPNAYNEDYNLTYDVTDGWLDDIMPSSMPDEGTVADMNFKIIVNRKVYHLYLLVQFHINANNEVTANVLKSAF